MQKSGHGDFLVGWQIAELIDGVYHLATGIIYEDLSGAVKAIEKDNQYALVARKAKGIVGKSINELPQYPTLINRHSESCDVNGNTY